LAKELKFPRVLKGTPSRELGAANEAGRCDKTLRPTDPTDTVADYRQRSLRRLMVFSRDISLRDSDLRMERITAIREAIAAGTYRISAASIAEKLIDHILIKRPPRANATE